MQNCVLKKGFFQVVKTFSHFRGPGDLFVGVSVFGYGVIQRGSQLGKILDADVIPIAEAQKTFHVGHGCDVFGLPLFNC